MKRKYLLYLVILAGLCLLLAGCGGNQNPLQLSGAAKPFWNGLWDGITIVIALVMELVSDHQKYGIYDAHQHARAYDVGYVLGVGGFIGGGARLLF